MATGIGEMRLQDRQASGWQSKPANLFAFDRKRYCAKLGVSSDPLK